MSNKSPYGRSPKGRQKTIYLFANWKMYLDYDESNILANALANEAKNFCPDVKVAIFPSALSLYPIRQTLNDVNIGVGAQNIYWVEKGGYTGEISAKMFKDSGCQYALVGHSERRHQFGESNNDVRKKIEAILSVGLTPVLCVGETQKQRENKKTEEVIKKQLFKALNNLTWPKKRELIIAYEPVWAIGTGLSCGLVDVEREHAFIQKTVVSLLGKIEPVILYGGSVRPENVAEFVSDPYVSGVLVGGASAKLESWLEIVKNACSTCSIKF